MDKIEKINSIIDKVYHDLAGFGSMQQTLTDSKKKDKVFFIISDVDNRRWLLIFFEWVGRPWKKII